MERRVLVVGGDRAGMVLTVPNPHTQAIHFQRSPNSTDHDALAIQRTVLFGRTVYYVVTFGADTSDVMEALLSPAALDLLEQTP